MARRNSPISSGLHGNDEATGGSCSNGRMSSNRRWPCACNFGKISAATRTSRSALRRLEMRLEKLGALTRCGAE
eukprot:1415393-Pleurochrysis_carterae.AAC.1